MLFRSDLFTEQGLWPWVIKIFSQAFEFLVEQGFPEEMVALELYGSGEAAEIFHQMSRTGFFKQMGLHSQTSQYGTLTRARRIDSDLVRAAMRKAITEIRDGSFANEWAVEQASGYPLFGRLKKEALAHPMNDVEQRVAGMIRAAGK